MDRDRDRGLRLQHQQRHLFTPVAQHAGPGERAAGHASGPYHLPTIDVEAIADGRSIAVTASFGAAVFDPRAPLSIAELLARADAALYRAKSRGRNRVESGDAGSGAESAAG